MPESLESVWGKGRRGLPLSISGPSGRLWGSYLSDISITTLKKGSVKFEELHATNPGVHNTVVDQYRNLTLERPNELYLIVRRACPLGHCYSVYDLRWL